LLPVGKSRPKFDELTPWAFDFDLGILRNRRAKHPETAETETGPHY